MASRSSGAGRRGYGLAALVLAAALCAVFVPPLARDQVLYPHDNAAEMGLAAEAPDASTLIYTDLCTLYVPEIHAHLACERASWLATWSPHNELGRPLFPCGIGRAHVLGHVLSILTSDPLRFSTWQTILAVAGTAAFAFLFLRALALHPLACLAGAAGISIGPIFGFWQAVPIVQWGYCWTFAALLGIERWLRRPSPWSWLGIAFAVHSVLLTGFQQHVLLLGWITASWLVLRTLDERRGRAQRLRALAAIAAAAAVGACSVAPVWIDLYLDWRASARASYVMNAGPWPRLAARFWVALVKPLWSGDAGARSCSLSPLFAGLAAVAAVDWRKRHAWMWLAWAAVAIAATLFEAPHVVLRRLGLVLSDWPAIFSGLLPCAVLAALGADRVLRSRGSPRLADVAACLVPFLVAAVHAPRTSRPFDRGEVIAAVLLAVAVLVLVWKPSPLLLLAVLAATVAEDGLRFVEWRSRDWIQTDSPLAAEVRRRTADGSRFAWVGPRPPGHRFLRPNGEIVLGLASLHTNDNLVSRAFYDWARELGPSPRGSSYDRLFDELTDEACADEELLAAAGVSTLLSLHPPDPAVAAETVRIADTYVSAVLRPGPLEARLPPGTFALPQKGSARVAPDRLRAHTTIRRRETGAHERLRFTFPPMSGESLVFVSQQYNDRWEARGGGRRLETVRINGLFQGVLVPPDVTEVELEFRAWSRFAIVPQAIFALAGIAACVAAVRQRATRRAAGAAGRSEADLVE